MSRDFSLRLDLFHSAFRLSRCSCLFLAIIISLGTWGVGESHAQGKAEGSSQRALEEIRAKIEREEKRLESVQRKREDLEQKLERLKQDQEKLSQDRAQLSSKDIDLDSRVKKLELAVEKGKEALKFQRAELDRRVVAVYKMQRRAGAVDYLVASSSATDLMRRLGYLTRIARADRLKLDKLADYLEGFEREKEELQRAKTERAYNLENMLRLEREISKKAEETGRLLSELKNEEQVGETALAKLRESAASLESTLGRIMGSQETVELPTPVSSASVSSAMIEGATALKEEVVVSPFEGRGVGDLRGSLPSPVSGAKLVQRFGKQKHEEFADMLFVKGLEFKAEPGSQVRAVAKGRVALNQVLPGYGNVLIIDHGNRHYTLYGRLANALAKLGAVVSQGEVIATLGDPDKKGRNFYFELRIQGKPVNPIDYLKQRPSS